MILSNFPYISNVTVKRVGTDLYIEATRVNGWYTASVRYRYRELPSGAYSEWTTIQEKEATGIVSVTEHLNLDTSKSYEVVVGTLDVDGRESNTKFVLPSDDVFLEKDGEMNSISVGEPVSEPNTVTIGDKHTVRVKKRVLVGSDSEVNNKIMAAIDSKTIKLGGDIDELGTKDPSYLVSMNPDDAGGIGVFMLHEDAGYIYNRIETEESGYYAGGCAQSEYWNASRQQLTVGCLGNRSFVKGLTEPVEETDAVNKAYVDRLVSSLLQEINTLKTALSNQ